MIFKLLADLKALRYYDSLLFNRLYLFRTTGAGWGRGEGGYRAQGILVVPETCFLSWIQLTPVSPEPLHPVMNKPSLSRKWGQVPVLWSLSGVLSPKTWGVWVPLSYHQLYTNMTFLCSSLTWLVSESAWAAIIKYHILCDLNYRSLFSHTPGDYELKVPSVLVLVRSLFWHEDGHLLAVFSHSLFSDPAWGEREGLWLSLPPRRTPILLDSNPALKTTVSLNHLLTDLISKYSSIRDYKLQHMNFKGHNLIHNNVKT